MNMTLFKKVKDNKCIYWLAITLVYASNKSYVERVFLTEQQAISCSEKYHLSIVEKR